MTAQIISIGVEMTHTSEHPICGDPTCPCALSAPVGRVLVAADISPAVAQWLEVCGATIIDSGVVVAVILPESAIIERSGRFWQHTVSFFDDDGEEIEPGLVVELDIDARETRIAFNYTQRAA